MAGLGGVALLPSLGTFKDYRAMRTASRRPLTNSPRIFAPDTLAAALALAGAFALLPACGLTPIEDRPAYPALADESILPQSRVLAVQVRRDGTSITLTNTTASTIPAGRLWLNRFFGRDFAPMAPGETRTIALKEFVNLYGEPYRAGGFFSTERSDPLRQAQLEVGRAADSIAGTPPAGELVGLIIVGNSRE
jgi:hypothetical protein